MDVIASNLPHDANHSKHACDSISDQFDYFSPIHIESAQIGSTDGYVRPVSGINDHGPFLFVLEPHGDQFLKLSSLHLYAKYKVVKSDNTDLDENEDVSVINSFASSMWSQTEVMLNDIEWWGGSATMSNMKTYMETLLSYESSSRDTHLRAGLFHLDTPGQLDTHANNNGYKKRAQYIAKSRSFDCVTPVSHDFLRCNKHLLPGQKLSIRLTRASDDFLILTGTDNKYKVKIEELRLYAERIKLDPAVTAKILQHGPHKFLGNRTEMRSYALPSGLTSKTLTISQGGILPKTVVVAQVDTQALYGNPKKNPFNFDDKDLNRISLRVNGTQVPADGYSPDFKNKLVMREYTALFLNSGMYRIDRGNSISLEAFLGGSTLFCWDLTTDKCAMHHGEYIQVSLVFWDFRGARKVVFVRCFARSFE